MTKRNRKGNNKVATAAELATVVEAPKAAPTAAEIDAVIASIDPLEEIAESAQTIDWHTENHSWNNGKRLGDLEVVGENLSDETAHVVTSKYEDFMGALDADVPAFLKNDFLATHDTISELSASDDDDNQIIAEIAEDEKIEQPHSELEAVSFSTKGELINLTAEIDEGEPLKLTFEDLVEFELEAPIALDTSNALADLDTIMNAFDESAVKKMVFDIAKACETREAFEKSKESKPSIFSTLNKARGQLVTMRAARIMLACNVDPDFINREVHAGSKYNVYAIGKFADFVFGLTGGKVANAINNAITRSLFNMKREGKKMDMKTAQACCSKQMPLVDPELIKLLVRHTVSPSTAPTQASSTMQALTTLGIVNTEGSAKAQIWTLNDNAAAHALEEVLKKAA